MGEVIVLHHNRIGRLNNDEPALEPCVEHPNRRPAVNPKGLLSQPNNNSAKVKLARESAVFNENIVFEAFGRGLVQIRAQPCPPWHDIVQNNTL
jgi:hypothetical protein